MLLGFGMDFVESVENFAMNMLTVLFHTMAVKSVPIIFFTFFHQRMKIFSLQTFLPH